MVPNLLNNLGLTAVGGRTSNGSRTRNTGNLRQSLGLTMPKQLQSGSSDLTGQTLIDAVSSRARSPEGRPGHLETKDAWFKA